MLTYAAGTLLRSYISELVAECKGTDTMGDNSLNALNTFKNASTCNAWNEGEDSQLIRAVEGIRDWGKAYLQQLDAGYQLCAAVWCGIDGMEKARCYRDCVGLLRLMLATPFLQHRRGRMFNRCVCVCARARV